jgi:hypothetical protein
MSQTNYIAYMDDIITPTLNTTVVNPFISEPPTYTTVSSEGNIALYNYTYAFPSEYVHTPSDNTENSPVNTIFTPIIYTGYTGTNCRYTCNCCIPRYLNNYLSHVGTKIIPKNAEDTITFENIQDGDILIDFKRDNNKSEYECGAFYKESTLKFILESNKNQFTMEKLDKSSIVKYTAKY